MVVVVVAMVMVVTRIRKRDNAWEEVGKTGEVVKRKR